MIMKIPQAIALPLFVLVPLTLSAAGPVPPEKQHLDKIFDRRPFSPAETTPLDVAGGAGGTPDGVVDVRDLVVFLNGQPVSAWFESDETTALRSQSSVSIPIRFSKPVTGSLRIETGGTARMGSDFGTFGTPVSGFTGINTSITVNNALTASLIIPLVPNTTETRGERRLTLSMKAQGVTFNPQTLSVNRNGSPAPGYRPLHTIILKDAWKSWTGTINFPPESGFATTDVRFLMAEDRTVKMVIEDSKFFQSAVITPAQLAADGALQFSQPITGTFQAPGPPVPAQWAISFSRLPAVPTDSIGILGFAMDLNIANFPIRGVSKSFSAQMTLTLEN